LYLWGAQLEVGAFPTPYIFTEATTATRNASVAVINDIDESEWWNPAQGKLTVKFKFNATNEKNILSLSDGTVGNRVQVSITSGGTLRVFSDGVTDIKAGLLPDVDYTVTFRFTSPTKVDVIVGDDEPVSATTHDLGNMDRMYLGVRYDGLFNFLNGHIAQLIYTPSAGA
jgi:hypothetical protein